MAPGSRRTSLSWHRAAARPCRRCCPPRSHARDQAGDLQGRVHPGRAGDRDVLAGQVPQAAALRQGHDRDQARPRHEIRVIKRCVRLRQIMQQSHLRGVLSIGIMAASTTPIIPAQRAPFASPRLDESPFTRWIKAKAAIDGFSELLIEDGDRCGGGCGAQQPPIGRPAARLSHQDSCGQARDTLGRPGMRRARRAGCAASHLSRYHEFSLARDQWRYVERDHQRRASARPGSLTTGRLVLRPSRKHRAMLGSKYRTATAGVAFDRVSLG